VLKKQWLTAGDHRVRSTHAAAGGQVVPVNEQFSVGGWLCDYPRDPVLPASESVNCRCHSIPHVDDEVLEAL
jgi:uncharacterized protein with gpF-like domain